MMVDMPENTETPTEIPAPPVAREAQQDGVVVSGADKDTIYLSKAVYKNSYAKQSLTVHHIQRRLGHLGFEIAEADFDGWYGDLTKEAVAAYQESKGYTVTGLMDKKTFSALFRNDPHVRLVFDE